MKMSIRSILLMSFVLVCCGQVFAASVSHRRSSSRCAPGSGTSSRATSTLSCNNTPSGHIRGSRTHTARGINARARARAHSREHHHIMAAGARLAAACTAPCSLHTLAADRARAHHQAQIAYQRFQVTHLLHAAHVAQRNAEAAMQRLLQTTPYYWDLFTVASRNNPSGRVVAQYILTTEIRGVHSSFQPLLRELRTLVAARSNAENLSGSYNAQMGRLGVTQASQHTSNLHDMQNAVARYRGEYTRHQMATRSYNEAIRVYGSIHNRARRGANTGNQRNQIRRGAQSAAALANSRDNCRGRVSCLKKIKKKKLNAVSQ